MDENKEELFDRIHEILEKMHNLDPTSEEYLNASKVLKELYSAFQEDYKLNVEAYTRDENLELEKQRLQIEVEKLNLDKDKFKESKKWWNRIPIETMVKCGCCMVCVGICIVAEAGGLPAKINRFAEHLIH